MEKTIERIKKLLNLARDGGATEAEANLAMARAEQIMMDNNLSMAAVEASGHASGGEARLKEGAPNANYRWQRQLMAAIAASCFCDCEVIMKRVPNRGGFRDLATGYELIGRISNVTMARQMYEYLVQTASRLAREYLAEVNHESGLPRHGKRDGVLFTEGLAARLAARVRDRHATALREQRAKVEAEAAARHASGQDFSVPVVIMEDFAQAEKEANNDIRNGWPLGTTKAKREGAEARSAEQRRRMDELKAAGHSWDVAYYVVYIGMTLEKAIETDRADQARKAAAGPRKEEKTRRFRYSKTREDRMNENAHRRSFTEGYRAGAEAADRVSLDDQIARGSGTKKLA